MTKFTDETKKRTLESVRAGIERLINAETDDKNTAASQLLIMRDKLLRIVNDLEDDDESELAIMCNALVESLTSLADEWENKYLHENSSSDDEPAAKQIKV